jgi:uncharacterized membrane protein
VNRSGYKEPEVSGWVRVPAGLFLLGISLLCLVGSAYMVYAPLGGNPSIILLIGTVLLVCSLWAVATTARLIVGRRAAGGGLFSPFALRVGGVLFLALPVLGLFTGAYSGAGPRLIRVVQATVYVLFAVAVFRLAGKRARRRRVDHNEHSA